MAGNGLARLGGCVWLDGYVWLGVSAAAAAVVSVIWSNGGGHIWPTSTAVVITSRSWRRSERGVFD